MKYLDNIVALLQRIYDNIGKGGGGDITKAEVEKMLETKANVTDVPTRVIAGASLNYDKNSKNLILGKRYWNDKTLYNEIATLPYVNYNTSGLLSSQDYKKFSDLVNEIINHNIIGRYELLESFILENSHINFIYTQFYV